MIGVGSGRAAEQQLRLIGGTPREHAHAQFVEHGWMIRRPLRHVGQQLVGFRRAARCFFRLRSLQNANDGRFIERRRGSGIHRIIV